MGVKARASQPLAGLWPVVAVSDHGHPPQMGRLRISVGVPQPRRIAGFAWQVVTDCAAMSHREALSLDTAKSPQGPAAHDRPSSAARVRILSFRAALPSISRCNTYEFEDTICAIDDADLVVAAPRRISPTLSRVLQTVSRRSGWNITAKRQLAPLSVDGQYEMTFVAVQSPNQLTHLRTIKGWRESSRLAVCYLEEVWKKWVEDYAGPTSPLQLLKDFDHVFVNCFGSIAPLQALIGRPVHYLPPAVDALRFCPSAERRSIDVYYMGRRSPVTHQALIDLLTAGRLAYLFDSIVGQDVLDVQQHRLLLASMLKNCRYFVVQTAKADRDDHTSGQQEVGFRFFEGAAAGTVMIGSAPEVSTFEMNFDWPDVVVPMPYDYPAIGEMIAELDNQPERLARIRHDNVVNCLRRHDWCHRWVEVLNACGLPLPSGVSTRIQRLTTAAEEVGKLYADAGLTAR
jgi:hypothetical protein